MQWKDLSISEREVMAIKFGVSCQGEMELQSEEELKKIPEFAWVAVEEARERKKQFEAKQAEIMARKAKAEELPPEPAKKVVKKVKEIKLGAKKGKKSK